MRLRFAVLVCLLATVSAARAQVLYGSLTGKVSDPSGAAVPTVKVEALNEGTGISRTSLTDESGLYSFNDLQPGLYKVTFTVPAFRSHVQENLQIVANNIRRIDVQLEVARVTEAVTVSGAPLVLQTDRSTSTSRFRRLRLPTSRSRETPDGTGRHCTRFCRASRPPPSCTPTPGTPSERWELT